MRVKRPFKIWPFAVIVCVWLVLFWPFFRKGLLPIPADIVVGVYYPWLDYKWGYPTGVPVKNPLISDIPSILYPWRSLVVDELKSFHWPLWNPYYFDGMPLLANFQSAVFSYVNVFFFFLPKALAWSAGVMVSPFLTMFAVYLFLRHKKLDRIPSLFGAVIFGLCGFEIAWLEYNVHGHTVLFFPLLLLAIDKILGEKKKLWLFLLPFLVAFQIFSGYIPVVIYSTIACFFYTLYFYVFPQVSERRIEWGNDSLLVVFWILGYFLSAIQLLPGYELTVNSIRSIDPIVEASNASYLPLKNLVTFIAPDFFGSPVTRNYFGVGFYDNFYSFVGTGSLILVILSLFFLRKTKDIHFWFFILLFSFILVFKNPLGMFLEKVLFLSGGVAAKALFLTDFSLAVLSAWGLEKFMEKSALSSVKKLFPVLLVGASFLIIARFSILIANPISRITAQRNLVIPFGFFLSISFALTIGTFVKKVKMQFVGMAILFLTSAQLLYSARKYLPFSREDLLFPQTPVINFLKGQKNESKEPFRVELGNVISQNFLMPYGIETTSGYDALLPKRTGEFLSLIENGDISERISRVHLINQYDSPLYPVLNTKYVLVKKITDKGIYSPEGKPDAQFLSSRYTLAFEDKTIQVYEDKKYLPRAFIVHDYKVVEENQGFKKVLLSGIDFSKQVLLGERLDLGANKQSGFDEKISWLDNKPGRIAFAVETQEPGLIFLSNNHFPGWKATIDNIETKIYRTNYTFQSIKIGAGKHIVTFDYFPKSFFYGGLISLFTLLNWLLFSGVFLLKEVWRKKFENN